MWLPLFVNIPAVGDARDAQILAGVVDDVHDAVVSDADTPEVLVPLQFLAAGGLGLAARPSIFDTTRAIRPSLNFSSSRRADGLISMEYLAT
jgi:hypothetical protein